MEENVSQGLYRPEFEHDSCGIGFIAHLKGRKSHQIVRDGITMLTRMEHRGACGCEKNTGDGAGILIQLPHEFFVEECINLGINLPKFGRYGVGMVFFPQDEVIREDCRVIFKRNADKLGLKLLGYRRVPTNNKDLGPTSSSSEPWIEQVFVGCPETITDSDAFERKLFILRKHTIRLINEVVTNVNEDFFIASLSHKTIAYKGQLTTHQLNPYFPDLYDERIVSAIAVIHSRFSTNTFPSWKLAQPFRFIAHNGEINTLKGNVNWLRSQEPFFESKYFTKEEMNMILPVTNPTQSDSAIFDNMVEMLVLCGRSLPHAMMMMIPEAWDGNQDMEEDRKAFYEYHASLNEPWDGPASIVFTDGKLVGATLDRNGLRPSRYIVTDDDLVVMASESGVLDINPEKVILKGRLQAGKMFVVNLEEGRIITDEELKSEICNARPYGQWLKENKIRIEALPESISAFRPLTGQTLLKKQLSFGYSKEDLNIILAPMGATGKEPIGSMGQDTPLAILSDQTQHLSHYFKQLFAQVTNPPIDPIRERLVMSLVSFIGGSQNLLDESPKHCHTLAISQPILKNSDLEKIRSIDHQHFQTKTIQTIFKADGKPGTLERALERICRYSSDAVEDGFSIVLLSDRGIDSDHAPIPSLLAVSAVHHHLMRTGQRGSVGLVLEVGDAWETHHFATLIGFGASAVNPYMAFESLRGLKEDGLIESSLSDENLENNFIKAVSEGLLKIFSKMGISTLQSYQGAQIFEALGINQSVVFKHFTGTTSRIGGMGLDEIAREALLKHHLAYPETPIPFYDLQVGGIYQWKRKGEFHLFNPESIHLLQYSTATNNYSIFKKFIKVINDQNSKACTLRGLLAFKPGKPVPIDEVEPVEEIMKRFATGAMSFGSISHEAHSTLAIAMNRIGAKSNTGEGGEDEIRYIPLENGDSERSAVKQVASGRFGVTSYYLTNADELQIKMAQGAKPGEGGQLPGHKVDEWIGRVRHSTPGVGLISPPPHHDIYSIEDLAQLIFDLKNANREARISVKLVSEAGVGTIASGVAKAKADVVLISGNGGGTGASPISSMRHAGLPWELGLAEAHQTLVMNNLRSRVVLQTDGLLRTGKDIAIATLLGAEEWGIATAALIVEGCIMMRKCHLNTCPVGIATQDETLRKRFTGNPDHIVNFFRFLAEDLREVMAELGFRTINEMVGQSDRIEMRSDINHWKYKKIDLKQLLYKAPAAKNVPIYHCDSQDHEIENVLDRKLIKASEKSITKKSKTYGEFTIENTDRAVGTMLSNEISKAHKSKGLPDDTIHFKFKGTAGQSFAAFGTNGLTFELEGDANDYFGKGLSGARLVLYPDEKATFVPSENIILGNVAFYGATSGSAYIRGKAGERFCVRNSGVNTVVEGVGDHACEYMTGGRVIILGETGRNFAAGMSGGIAYVYDPDNALPKNANMESILLEPLDNNDIDFVSEMIQNHILFTQSRLGKKLFENRDLSLSKFKKVMPIEYKAALLNKKSMSIVHPENSINTMTGAKRA